MSISKYVKFLPENKVGRDFVVGDIHGTYELVESFLSFIDFNKTKDRLISCADLIDRGTDNEKVLNYLYEPWFHAVRGNHEDMAIEWHDCPAAGFIWSMNGGSWCQEHRTMTSDESVFVMGCINDVLRNLPDCITVGTGAHKFHCIHAELFWDTPVTDDDLASEEWWVKNSQITTADGPATQWGRFIFLPLYEELMDERAVYKYKRTAELNKFGQLFNDKLSHIYSGHTIVKQPTRFKGQTNLDTGAYKSSQLTYSRESPRYPWAGLTFTEPKTGLFWTVKPSGVEQATLLDLSI